MERFAIYVTSDELNFIREAVESKIDQLMIHFDDCEELSDEAGVKPPKDESVLTAVHHSMVGKSEAPWGLKKDGTPKARPGRKVARKGRA